MDHLLVEFGQTSLQRVVRTEQPSWLRGRSFLDTSLLLEVVVIRRGDAMVKSSGVEHDPVREELAGCRAAENSFDLLALEQYWVRACRENEPVQVVDAEVVQGVVAAICDLKS